MARRSIGDCNVAFAYGLLFELRKLYSQIVLAQAIALRFFIALMSPP